MANIIPYRNILPNIDKSVFIANNAVISGDVKIAKNSSIWYNCVLRGD
ncbi:MAG: gamma carbonic anhydrase family protein, partial [Alphaproteobacteria bacterium]